MKSCAHAVIGANYGDEGKGLMTDYLCVRERAELVVRFNGGAQAGHTVVTPNGARHVFHHHGSGGLLGVPTFLSKYFVVNPILFDKEFVAEPMLTYVDPYALVTTPFDMLINQALENARKVSKHGSCGVGINETMQRSKLPKFRLQVSEMLSRPVYALVAQYAEDRAKELGLGALLPFERHWEAVYFDFAEKFLQRVIVTPTPPGKVIVFEGAQGLMLDQNSPDFPHVTHSNTGIKNVIRLCQDLGVDTLHTTYVTRSYLTRHGAGPLPGEVVPVPEFVIDPTNVDHEFQGRLRYAPLDVLALERRILHDVGGHSRHMDVAMTCLDQYDEGVVEKFSLPVAYKSYGPTRKDVVAK